MNLQEVAQKYRISDNFLNSKDDGLLVASKSIQDLINEINQDAKRGIDENRKQSIITKMEMLRDFLKDVKNSGV
jgi:predicted RNA-binding protein with EMAP domain|tara:strand:- start:46 stop:267 length:222 start_codon:yes stop_codon:yes gene_type:complete